MIILKKGLLSSPFTKGNVSISHLFFADDVMIFISANSQIGDTVKTLLDDLKTATGLTINASKSSILFSGCHEALKQQIVDTLGFNQASLLIKYLGLPLVSTGLTLNDCLPLIKKLTNKLSRWKSKLLSCAGRIKLINSTLCSLYLCWASIFILPRACIKLLDKYIKNFFWGHTQNNRKLKPIAWNLICTPRLEGGLGLRSVKAIAAAAIQWQVWTIVTKRKSAWTDWVYATLIRNKNFWDLKIPSECSWRWKGILSTRIVALQNLQILIGNGRMTNFWFDPWLPSGRLYDLFDERAIYDLGRGRNLTVSNFISNGKWLLSPATSNHLLDINQMITSMEDPQVECEDEIIWKNHELGIFTKKSAMKFNPTATPTHHSIPMVWFKGQINKHSVCSWFAIVGGLKTRDLLFARNFYCQAHCTFCNHPIEIAVHLFIHCPFGQHLWGAITQTLNVTYSGGSTIAEDLLSFIAACPQSHQDLLSFVIAACPQSHQGDTVLFQICFHVLIWNIWMERNSRIFKLEAKAW